MRYFARLLGELQNIAATRHPGEVLTPPPLLNSVQIDGKRVCYFEMGLKQKGPAIILLHGFGGFFMDWPRIMAPLSNHHRVFAIDLPGWGFSEPRTQLTEIEGDAGLVQEFIKIKNLKEVILVGISYGAGVAWATAALKVPEIKKLVLLNPMPPHPLKHLKSPLYRLILWVNSSLWRAKLSHRLITKRQYKNVCKENLYNTRLLDSFYLRLGFLVIKQPHVAITLHQHALGAKLINWDKWVTAMKQIDIPTLILQGKQDKLFNTKSAHLIADLIPRSRVVEIDECGHALVFDHHKEVIRYVHEWTSV